MKTGIFTTDAAGNGPGPGALPTVPCYAVPAWKRPLDLLSILVSAPLWLPVALLCAVWIALVSRGQVLFTQERVGHGGRRFTILKFRTMHPGADTQVHDQYLHQLIGSDQPMTKLDGKDARLIRGGKILRAAGLDELPQLVNVIRGEMSLVGPRPCTPAELAKYKPCYLKRFAGLPGLTGNWQVNGKNRTSFRRMIALDIRYVQSATLAGDLLIMLRTLPAVLNQVGDLVAKWKAGRSREAEARISPAAAAPPARMTQTTRSVYARTGYVNSHRTHATQIIRIAK